MASGEGRRNKKGGDILKKLLTIAAVLVLAVMLMPSAVFAADPPTTSAVNWIGTGIGSTTFNVGSGTSASTTWTGAGTVNFNGSNTVVAPTTSAVNWNGAGLINSTFTAGNDAVYNFATGGDSIVGGFNAQNSYDNPYSYKVDTSSSYINADVANGLIYYEANRTDAYAPMYGPAGQVAASYVGSQGTGEMATGSGNNYASMGNGTYAQPHTSGGYNYQADGASYLITSFITSKGGATLRSDGLGLVMDTTSNYAYFDSFGSGTSKINDMTNEASAGGVNLGLGGGCYTNANAVMTGTGTFTVHGVGTNGIQSALGAYTLGGAGSTLNIAATGTGITYGSGVTTTGNGFGSTTLNVIANYGNGATVSNYSLSVH